mmetsp:Transcript_62887/g.153115  ORF Transcript_62887/g.153115 Transcript_62887/m.153115 type:complete len:373 (-) Transcript_62887:63-1181(-)
MGLIGAGAAVDAAVVDAAGAVSAAGAGAGEFAAGAGAASDGSLAGSKAAGALSVVAVVDSSSAVFAFGLRLSLGREVGLAADDAQDAPPPTGVFLGGWYATWSCFCFSSIASAAARSGNNSWSSVSTFWDPPPKPPDAAEPHREAPPSLSLDGTHLLPPGPPTDAAAAPNLFDALSAASCSFFSFSSLIRWASRSIPSRAAANLFLFSSIRNFSAICSSSLPFRSSDFMSSKSRVFCCVVPPAALPAAGLTVTGTTTVRFTVCAANASSSHWSACASFVASAAVPAAPFINSPPSCTSASVDIRGASTWTVDVTVAASILLALKPLNPFFFFFLLAKNAAASAMMSFVFVFVLLCFALFCFFGCFFGITRVQ